MISILWFFLPGILALGIITSYTDIKFGKIKNWAIVGAIVYAILAYTVVALLGYDVFSVDLFTNAGFALLVGAGFWLLGLWSAADGKLFFAFSLLVPLSCYSFGYTNRVPSIVLVINTFAPLFLFAFFQLLFFTSKKEKLFAIKQLTPKTIVYLVFSIFAMHWITKLLTGLIPVEHTFLLGIVMMFVVIAVAAKAFGRYYLWIIAALSVFRIFFEYNSILTPAWALEFLSYLVFYLLLRFSIYSLGFSFYTKKVHAEKLKPGMVLAEGIYKSGGKFKKEKAGRNIFSLPAHKFVVPLSPEGITASDAETLRKTGAGMIRVHETLPFSPFLFFGVIITLAVQGNLLNYIIMLFSNL